MADDNGNPSSTVTDPPGTSGAAGDENAKNTLSAMSLEDINKLTGRTYTTLEDAQKGIKETYSHVGRQPEVKVVEKEVVKIPEGMVSREEFDQANFFRDTPEANKHRELLSTIAKAHGLKPQDVYAGAPENSPASKMFKDTVAQLSVAEKANGTRSALTSDSRLGVISDAATKATEKFRDSQKAFAQGDRTLGATLHREAENAALSAVLKAYPNMVPEGNSIVD